MSGQWQDGDQSDPHLGCPTCVMPLDHQREIRRWRKAAVTWTDHMLGKMYKHMQQLSPEVAAKTIVVSIRSCAWVLPASTVVTGHVSASNKSNTKGLM